jgi:hypothetical protein
VAGQAAKAPSSREQRNAGLSAGSLVFANVDCSLRVALMTTCPSGGPDTIVVSGARVSVKSAVS